MTWRKATADDVDGRAAAAGAVERRNPVAVETRREINEKRPASRLATTKIRASEISPPTRLRAMITVRQSRKTTARPKREKIKLAAGVAVAETTKIRINLLSGWAITCRIS